MGSKRAVKVIAVTALVGVPASAAIGLAYFNIHREQRRIDTRLEEARQEIELERRQLEADLRARKEAICKSKRMARPDSRQPRPRQGWLCDELPCNEGDLHSTDPPEGTEHFRDPVPVGPDTKPKLPPSGP